MVKRRVPNGPTTPSEKVQVDDLGGIPVPVHREEGRNKELGFGRISNRDQKFNG